MYRIVAEYMLLLLRAFKFADLFRHEQSIPPKISTCALACRCGMEFDGLGEIDRKIFTTQYLCIK